jgi:hypothetical protein
MVDQLYDGLMRWTPPCAPASTNASWQADSFVTVVTQYSHTEIIW